MGRSCSLLLISSLLALGCGERASSDGPADGGGQDGGRALSPNPDECGNGLDDDDDGRIDDGCPCAPGEMQSCFAGAVGEREVGICADGIQTCAGRGSVEWGDWGDSRCEGGITPASEERCDGADHDCDGAIDEGCPCTAGQEQECGLEFLVGRCMGGTQVCRPDGTWSGCEGAVGPEAELCGPDGMGNGIDEDCNGIADDPCGCVPEPEVCRDGVDNDCDGTVDEPSCTPDWPPDGGVPDAGTPDAGIPSCDPSLLAPRPIAPLSTSRVTSRRPGLSWELPPGASEAMVELCSDPACTVVLETLLGATSVRPTSPVSSGATFWRVRTMGVAEPSCATSPTWEFFSGVRDTGLDTTQGFNADYNRDGHPDFIMAARWVEEGRFGGVASAPVFEVVYGQAAAPPDGATNQPLSSGDWVANLGDVDGDGFGDVLLDGDAIDTCEVHRGTASGISPTVSATLVDCRGGTSGLGDFDGDGYGDFIVGSGSREAGVLPPRLVFGSATLVSLVEVPHLFRNVGARNVGDLNGDGLADVIAIRSRKISAPVHAIESVPAVFYGNTARAWGAGTTLGTYLVRSVGLVGTDVDGDGYGDLVLTYEGIRVYHGGPGGIDTTGAGTGTLDWPPLRGRTTCMGDVNGDGFEDVMVNGDVFLGGGTGLRTDTVFWAALPHTWFSAVGDLDGDGYEDVIMEEETAPIVRVLARLGTPTGLGAGSLVPFMATSSDPGYRARRIYGIACN